MIICTLIMFVAVFVMVTYEVDEVIAGIVVTPMLFTEFAVVIKRLHDTNKSGWHIFIGLVPIIGVIYLFVVCGCLKGIENDNKYGSPVDRMI